MLVVSTSVFVGHHEFGGFTNQNHRISPQAAQLLMQELEHPQLGRGKVPLAGFFHRFSPLVPLEVADLSRLLFFRYFLAM